MGTRDHINSDVDVNILQVLDETIRPGSKGDGLTRQEREQLLQILEEKETRKARMGHLRWFPEDGPLAYDKYPKHMEFLANTKDDNECLFLAANRAGKTIAGAYAVACWATGVYPSWWEGRVFEGATSGWCGGDTGQTTRDIIQKELLGEPGMHGTGMLPYDSIAKIVPRPGIPNAVDHILVENVQGGLSYVGFKSYDQGRRAWQGTAKDWIHLDEEPPLDVYSEALIRTMTTRGIIISTLTPLKGLTPFINSFLEQADMMEVTRG